MAVDYTNVLSMLQSHLKKSKVAELVKTSGASMTWADARDLGTRGALLLPAFVRDALDASTADTDHRTSSLESAEKAAKAIHDNEVKNLGTRRALAKQKALSEYESALESINATCKACDDEIANLEKRRDDENASYNALGLIAKGLGKSEHLSRLAAIDKAINDNRAVIANVRQTQPSYEMAAKGKNQASEQAYERDMALANDDFNKA